MSDLSLAALEQQAAMGGSIGADILGTTAASGLGPLAGLLGPASLFASILSSFLQDEGLQETPMTPEERTAFEAQQRLALAGSQLAQGGEGAKEMVLDAIGQAVLDGVNQSEIDYVTDLINRGVVTAEEVSLSTGIPEQEIQSVYEQQRREPSVLELLQTGPVQPVDIEGGIGDVASTGDVTGEEVVDLSQRTTDDLITIDDLMADTTASTVDTGAVDIEEPSSYSWIYEDGGFVYAPFGVGGNRLPGGERIPASDVAGTEGRTFEEGQNVNVLFLPDGTATLEDVQDTTDEKVSVFGDITGGLVGTGGITGGGLVGDTVVQTPTGTPGTVKQVGDGGKDGGGDGLGDGVGDGLGDGVGDGDGVRSELIMRFSQQAPITEQMFSRELFEPQMKELNNVAKAMGLLQDIARGFA